MVAAIFIPNEKILLDNTIDFKKLTSTISLIDRMELFLYNINGFNFKSAITKYNLTKTSYAVSNGYFDFYLFGKRITSDLCDASNFKRDMSFFGSLFYLNVIRNVRYSTQTCPFGFINSKIAYLLLGEISNSLIYKNRLEFIQLNNTNGFGLYNKNFSVLGLKCAYENITLKLIDKNVFKYMNQLKIYGIITDLERDLFKHFEYLRALHINIENLVRTLSLNNKWIGQLNTRVSVNLYDQDQINLHFSFLFLLSIASIDDISNTPYKYPDEDFCLFQYFPHDHLVFPMVCSTIEFECSCTIVFLFQHYEIYLTPDLKYIKHSKIIYMQNCNDNLKKCFNKSMVKACGLEGRIKKCNKSEFSSESVADFEFKNSIDIVYFLKWCELIVFVFLQPFLCSFGIITNFLTIIVLKSNNNIEKMKDTMYKHIFINSIFNIVYCMLILIKEINICIFDLSPFCSAVYQAKASQYFQLYGLFFFGNAIKLCCNISYISFSVSRFLLSTNKHPKTYRKLERLNIKAYYFIIFCASILLSLFKIFEYQINEIYLPSKSYPFKIYDVGSCENGSVYCTLFRVFNIINDFIKDVLFFFTNLIIDILLFRTSQKNVKHKKKILNDIIKIDIAIKFKNKMNRMVFLNGILFFIAYFPEFITNITLIVFDKKINLFCYQNISCSVLNEFAQFFNFISIGLQFFILKKFNKTFNKSFNDFKSNLLNRFKMTTKKPSNKEVSIHNSVPGDQ